MKKLLGISSFLAIFAGVLLILAGIWGISFTYNTIARENITTPSDASIPDTPVRGPLTLQSQADIIRHHVLETTDGKTYSEMPSKVEKIQPDGTFAMVPNDARTIWITATTLITALHLGIITYVFSGLVIFIGFISVWTGITFYALKKSFV
ncbi:MAG: hypothetical protein R3B39_02375 [Candidatus Paceibacterota bacterium]